MAPRFMLVLGHELHGQLAPAWPGAGRADRPRGVDGQWVAWRLLGSNHRELARSAGTYATADEACAAVRRVCEHIDDAVVTSVATSGRWDWQLSVDGELLAVASRLYQRPRECAYNLGVTVAAIRVATTADVAPRILRAPGSDEALEMDNA